MNFAQSLITAGLVVATTPAFAGFVDLPTNGTLRVYGSNNILVDPLFIPQGNLTGGTGGPGDPFTFDLPSNFVLLAAQQSEFELFVTEIDIITGLPVTALEEVGTFYDAVFRDSNDNKLVFGSRIIMDPTEEGEVNDIFRYGFYGELQAGWTFVTSDDLNLFSAARSLNSNIEEDDEDTFADGVVGLATDVNVEELKPQTGWYFIKTDATAFGLVDDAVGIFQAGEEGQEPYQARIDGFAPVPVPAAVWLFGSALAGMAGVARRRV